MNNKQGWFSVHFYPHFQESGFTQQKREYFIDMSSSWEYRSRAKWCYESLQCDRTLMMVCGGILALAH